jgi:hypothetical protein
MDITTMLYRIDCLVKAKGWSKEEFYAMVPISSSAVAQWRSKGRRDAQRNAEKRRGTAEERGELQGNSFAWICGDSKRGLN